MQTNGEYREGIRKVSPESVLKFSETLDVHRRVNKVMDTTYCKAKKAQESSVKLEEDIFL